SFSGRVDQTILRDPSLESLSVGQKALLRLGPTQAAAVKAQLQRIRTALLQGP
ncbi:DUF3014 domain-containing protein, partial [Xanthomonas oryzae]|uniref:DUF3014 domain-containing protein n=1 Tax=Xanthomonas oryzae TaxID=347 RepID=UPI00110FFC08